MRTNAPLASLLHVEIDPRRDDHVALTLGADLGDMRASMTIFLTDEDAIGCANALKQADRLLEAGQPGNITSTPFKRMTLDVNLDRGGVVLTMHLHSDINYYFLRGRSVLNQFADALLNAALDLQMRKQGTGITRH
jgi:hypothetical protein